MAEQLTFDEAQARTLETLYLSDSATRRRARALELVGMEACTSFLDLGCGPGFLSVEAAEGGRGETAVTAIDSSASMLAMARQRAEGSCFGGAISFLESDVCNLPSSDEQFDAAAVLQVYEYVADIPAALAQLARVLKPGGRFVILDTDWSTLGMHSLNPEMTERVFRHFEGHLCHAALPRALPTYIGESELKLSAVEPFVQVSHGQPDGFAKAVIKLVSDYVVSQGLISKQEATEWQQGLRAVAQKDAFFWSLTQFFFVGEKPGD